MAARALTVVSPAPRAAWREVVAADPYALPDHTVPWFDALCADPRFADASRLYTAADGRRFVLPLLRRRGVSGAGGSLLGYPTGCGIGGLVGAGSDPDVLTDVLTELRDLGVARIGIRPDPLRAADWAAAADRTDPRPVAVPRRAHVVELDGGRDAVLARMTASTRRGLRIAERKGVRVRVGRGATLLAEHQRLHRLSQQRWARRQHEPLALARWRTARRDPPAALQRLADSLGEDFVVLIADVDGQPVASNVTTYGVNSHGIRAAIDRERAGPVRAAELLEWHAIQLACERGCRVHHLGESGTAAGLSRFKERFGAVAVPYAEYRIERLPFTRFDALARTAVKRVLRFRDDD